MTSPLEQNFYELLEVPRDATLAEIDRAYDRARAYYGPGSVAVYALATPEELKQVQDRIDEAYLVLGDEAARAEYDARIGPPGPNERPLRSEVRRAQGEPAASQPEAPAERPKLSLAPEPPKDAAPDSAPGSPESSAPAPVEAQPSPTAAPAAAPEPAPVQRAPVEEPATPAVSQAEVEPSPASVPVAAESTPAAPSPPAQPELEPAAPAVEVKVELAAEPAPRPVEPAPTPAEPEVRTSASEGPIPPPPMASPEPSPKVNPVRREKPAEPAARAAKTDIAADAVFSGELLRKLREGQGLTLQEIADRTKIGRPHLENIEADRFGALPAQVYLRGFLMALARELRLDPLRVSKSYLEQMAESRAAAKSRS